jgi:NTF2 fold immunity protein of polymorphic toxin system component
VRGIFVVALVVVTSCAIAGDKVATGAEGTVATADAAVEIARAAAVNRYGEVVIRSEEPLTAELNQRNNWIVTGMLPHGAVGGVVEVEVARRDGKVLRMVHGQ